MVLLRQRHSLTERAGGVLRSATRTGMFALEIRGMAPLQYGNLSTLRHQLTRTTQARAKSAHTALLYYAPLMWVD